MLLSRTRWQYPWLEWIAFSVHSSSLPWLEWIASSKILLHALHSSLLQLMWIVLCEMLSYKWLVVFLLFQPPQKTMVSQSSTAEWSHIYFGCHVHSYPPFGSFLPWYWSWLLVAVITVVTVYSIQIFILWSEQKLVMSGLACCFLCNMTPHTTPHTCWPCGNIVLYHVLYGTVLFSSPHYHHDWCG